MEYNTSHDSKVTMSINVLKYLEPLLCDSNVYKLNYVKIIGNFLNSSDMLLESLI